MRRATSAWLRPNSAARARSVDVNRSIPDGMIRGDCGAPCTFRVCCQTRYVLLGIGGMGGSVSIRSAGTSASNKLRIAWLPAGDLGGFVGVTFAPGKKQRGGLTGDHDRDLHVDLDEVAGWSSAAVVTLMTAEELGRYRIPNLGEEVRARFMEWHHHPIEDNHAPDAIFEAAWPNASRRLRALVSAGNRVVVHCRGGLGRAGSVAARLLIEMGADPEDAIRTVRRERDPQAIQTTDQERWVRRGLPQAEVVPTDPQQADDRALGALLGLAVGDAVGTTIEFSSKPDRAMLSDMVGGGPFGLQPGQWTDDTAMAVALGESLLAHPDLDPADLMRRFVSWWREGAYSCTGRCFDIGGTTAAALRRFEQTGDPFAGSTEPNSAGNGSIMRLAPVAVRHWRDPERMRRVARDQSRTTHAAAEAVMACETLADILADAIGGTSLPALVSGKAARRVSGFHPGQERSEVLGTGYVVASLHAALWAVSRASGFREAVLLAANLGEDADTTAAIAGQIAGALYGASAIPTAWLDRLAWRERIESLASDLFKASTEEQVAGGSPRDQRSPPVQVVWDGLVKRGLLHEDAERLRDELADKAKSYDWPSVMTILEEHPQLVNTTRPGGGSLFLYRPPSAAPDQLLHYSDRRSAIRRLMKRCIAITNLVFLRRVNSRILYEQMIGRATRQCPEIGKEVFRIFDAVDLYTNLQHLTDMKPVVVNPAISFEQLIGELAGAQAQAERDAIREQLIVKLRRRLKHLSPETRDRVEAVAGETPEAVLARVQSIAGPDLSLWAKSYPALGPILDWRSDDGTPRLVPISYHGDEVVAVTRGYGEAERPEDFLDGFTAFVRDNVNTIAALKVVVQRPRDLTRAQLRELRLERDKRGFSEANLRRAWSDAKNEEIAASIVGFVRQAAIGDPLVPYAERVQAAMRRIMASRPWTDPQRRWLKRIGDQVAAEIVVDRDALDRPPFDADGGFTRLNKVFGGALESVLADVNEELWRESA